MKQTMIVTMAAVLSMVTASGFSFAQTTEDLMTTGVVLGVDVNQRVVSIEEADYQGNTLHFVLAEDAAITTDGRNISLGDVRVGDPVSIEYRESAGNNEIQSLEVIARPGAESTSTSGRR